MEILDLGTKPYSEVWELQKQLVEKRAAGEIPDTLLFVEHEPVYTVGRANSADGQGGASASSVHVRKLGDVPIVEIERGGKMTFHGPGQLVGYPIFALTDRDLRKYLRELERALVNSISEETLLPASPCPESLLLDPGQLQTGIWVRDKKLASIGIAVRKWVTYHGFALNVSTDTRYFDAIEPCGFSGAIMTTLEKELGGAANLEALKSNLKTAIFKRFAEISEKYAQIEPQAEPVVTAETSVN